MTTTTVKVVKKKSCVLAKFIASIWTRSICQLWAIFPGVEFLRTLSMFKKRREDSSSSIKRRIRRFHVVVVQWTSEKCNQNHDHTCKAVVLFNLSLL